MQWKSVLLGIIGLGLASSQAQDCDALRAAASEMVQARVEALAINQDLKRAFDEKLRNTLAAGLQPPQRVLLIPDPLSSNSAIYRDERGSCGRWGTVKDLREYKRDSIEHENQQLLDYIRSLSAQLDAQEAKDPAPPSPAPEVRVPAPSRVLTAQRQTFRGQNFAYCRFDPREADLRLGRGQATETSFADLAQQALGEDKVLVFAMNAGMYEADRQSVGLLVAKGQEYTPLNQSQGRGNFYLQPNGVFGVLEDGRAFVVSTQYLAHNRGRFPPIRLATQSGPMLLRKGQINRAFTPDSPNLHVRNAVGWVRETGEVICVISEAPVCFYDLAAFLQGLGCWQALYLDGSVSRMYLPALGRTEALNDSRHLGPVLYLLEPLND
jgi:uncharacterized protein YigE (DUF2233 family)